MGDHGILHIKKCLGQNGRIINIYKLRTMRLGAESKFLELSVNGLDSLGKIPDDPRITAVGRILRKYWIDELPQLYNFVQGDLKLVGIRPMTAETWSQYPFELMHRSLQQKPGLIGVNYFSQQTKNFKDNLTQITDYLDKWETDPVRTDREYLSNILKNIFFNGTRSR